MQLPNRIENKINKQGPNGCWLWMGTIGNLGYGKTEIKGKTCLVHRVVYQHLVGPIPDGLQLDHLCRTRSCVNPKHLEAVTCKTNIQRGNTGKDNQHKGKTHCKHGHLFDEANTRINSKGFRFCIECNKIRCREHYQQRKNKLK